MNIEDLTKEVERIEAKSDFVVSWWAKKYKKTIRRIGNIKRVAEYGNKAAKNICVFGTLLLRDIQRALNQ